MSRNEFVNTRPLKLLWRDKPVRSTVNQVLATKEEVEKNMGINKKITIR